VVCVEVRKPHGLLVDVPVPSAARRSSLESQARRRPPLRVAHCRRRPSAHVDTLVEFAVSSSTSRTKSRLDSCPGAPDRGSPAPDRGSPAPLPPFAPPLATAACLLAISSIRLTICDPDRSKTRSQTEGYRSTYLF
jgi:hypothetical protein